MNKSWKRQQREALGKGAVISAREFDVMNVLADMIEATPQGQRTVAMQSLLDDVRAVQVAHPAPDVGGGV